MKTEVYILAWREPLVTMMVAYSRSFMSLGNFAFIFSIATYECFRLIDVIVRFNA